MNSAASGMPRYRDCWRPRYRDAEDVALLAHMMGVSPERITRADVREYDRFLRACIGSSERPPLRIWHSVRARPRDRRARRFASASRRRSRFRRARPGDDDDLARPEAAV
jgi:hypothetical protein